MATGVRLKIGVIVNVSPFGPAVKVSDGETCRSNNRPMAVPLTVIGEARFTVAESVPMLSESLWVVSAPVGSTVTWTNPGFANVTVAEV